MSTEPRPKRCATCRFWKPATWRNQTMAVAARKGGVMNGHCGAANQHYITGPEYHCEDYRPAGPETVAEST